MKLLITGGAGFVGSRLAIQFCEAARGTTVHVIDNLRRRGSESNLSNFKRYGIAFFHGDIRNREDFDPIADQSYDFMLDCSADPSVHAGTQGSPSFVLGTNLVGTLNCLEFARRHCNGFIFLSTSRIYSIRSLRDLPLKEEPSRLVLESSGTGYTPAGINEQFPSDTARSFYGASKLASELIIQEYAETYDLPSVINRCSIIAGAGQFGKVDQGIVSHWLVSHLMNRPLTYTGFGGQGKQVRDLLHPKDLFQLIVRQIPKLRETRGQVFNVGGGIRNSISLRELTDLCVDITGKRVSLSNSTTTAKVDIPFYVTDNSKTCQTFEWRVEHGVADILQETHQWMVEDRSRLESIFG